MTVREKIDLKKPVQYVAPMQPVEFRFAGSNAYVEKDGKRVPIICTLGENEQEAQEASQQLQVLREQYAGKGHPC